jgi:hypothetical protein
MEYEERARQLYKPGVYMRDSLVQSEETCRLRLPRDRWAERGSGQKHLIKPLVKYHRHIISQQRSTAVGTGSPAAHGNKSAVTSCLRFHITDIHRSHFKNRFPLRCQEH